MTLRHSLFDKIFISFLVIFTVCFGFIVLYASNVTRSMLVDDRTEVLTNEAFLIADQTVAGYVQGVYTKDELQESLRYYSDKLNASIWVTDEKGIIYGFANADGHPDNPKNIFLVDPDFDIYTAQSFNGKFYNTFKSNVISVAIPIHINNQPNGMLLIHSTVEQLQNIQVEDALKHPNWSMGRKITIDSSTLVNKGLEVMEAKWLFGVDLDQIQVIVHPQSIIHSAVQYVDGAVIAQLGTPDMKLPIQYALFYPDRRPMAGRRLDFYELAQVTFEKPDMETFYGLKLAYDAQRIGGSMPTVYNAANEKAVGLFLDRKIAYLQIPELIQEAMEQHKVIENPNVEEILETEASVYSYIDGKGF